MFLEDKIIEKFSIWDDFSKVFDKTVDQNAICQNAIASCDSSKPMLQLEGEVDNPLTIFSYFRRTHVK